MCTILSSSKFRLEGKRRHYYTLSVLLLINVPDYTRTERTKVIHLEGKLVCPYTQPALLLRRRNKLNLCCVTGLQDQWGGMPANHCQPSPTTLVHPLPAVMLVLKSIRLVSCSFPTTIPLSRVGRAPGCRPGMYQERNHLSNLMHYFFAAAPGAHALHACACRATLAGPGAWRQSVQAWRMLGIAVPHV